MEVFSSAVTGAMRIGVQVVSSHKSPALEIYHQVRNRFSPEYEFSIPKGSTIQDTVDQKVRFQDVFVEFALVNIGGSRAENIKLSFNGSLPKQGLDELFNVIIPQMAPGQSRFLFKLDRHALNKQSDKPKIQEELKSDSFTIVMEYDAGKGIINWLMSMLYKIKRSRRFRDEYTFSPVLVAGDLPPEEYA